MKRSALSIVAVALAALALLLSVFQYVNPPRWKGDLGAKKPGDVVAKLQDLFTDDVRVQALQAFRSSNRSEILKTLEVVEVSESGDYGIVFFRYSIGTDIFREVCWVAKVKKRWYWMPNMEYSDAEPEDAAWYEKMKDKKDSWTADSAKSKFD